MTCQNQIIYSQKFNVLKPAIAGSVFAIVSAISSPASALDLDICVGSGCDDGLVDVCVGNCDEGGGSGGGGVEVGVGVGGGTGVGVGVGVGTGTGGGGGTDGPGVYVGKNPSDLSGINTRGAAQVLLTCTTNINPAEFNTTVHNEKAVVSENGILIGWMAAAHIDTGTHVDRVRFMTDESYSGKSYCVNYQVAGIEHNNVFVYMPINSNDLLARIAAQ